MTVKNDISDSASIVSSKHRLLTGCCCLPLRIVCFLLGYINLFFHGLQTLGLVMFTVEMGYAILGIDSLILYSSNNGTVDSASLRRNDPEFRSSEQHFLKEIGFILLATVMANVTTLIVMICCIIGLHLKRLGPVKLYLGFAIGRTCITLTALFVLIIYGPEAVHAIVGNIIGLCLSGYFVVVYYLYVKQYRSELLQQASNDSYYSNPTKNIKQSLIGQ